MHWWSFHGSKSAAHLAEAPHHLQSWKLEPGATQGFFYCDVMGVVSNVCVCVYIYISLVTCMCV
jgi:hypothetical protein